MSDPEDVGASPRRSGPIPESRTTETASELWTVRPSDRYAHAGGPYVVNLDAWTRFYQALNRVSARHAGSLARLGE